MTAMQSDRRWRELLNEVLPVGWTADGALGSAETFLALGGSSLAAMRLVALAERQLGLYLTVPELLSSVPLADLLARAYPVVPGSQSQPASSGGDLRRVSAGQLAMLAGEELHGGTAFHLLFSADIQGRLDVNRLFSVLAAVTSRHESLRTVFVRHHGEIMSQALPGGAARVVLMEAPDPGEVSALQAALGAGSACYLNPFERPPAAWVITQLSPKRHLLSLLAHHAIIDGWSIGLLFRQIFSGYRDGISAERAPSPGIVVDRERSSQCREAAVRRARALAGVPAIIELPSDLRRPRLADRRGARLPFRFGDPALRACAELEKSLNLTRNAVLLAAWGLVISRRTGVADLLIGVAASDRADPELQRMVGYSTKVLPVRVIIARDDTVVAYLRAVGSELTAALGCMPAPLEWIARELGAGSDSRRNRLVQFGFAAHDELVPSYFDGGGIKAEMHEGYCGGTVFDANLYVQRWDAEERLVLEFATSVLAPDEAGALAAELEASLVALAERGDGLVRDLSTVTLSQAGRLQRWGQGSTVDLSMGLWQLIAEACVRHGDAPAVRDGDDRELSYSQLGEAVERQAAELHRAGVRPDDTVAIALRRSAAELVAVLATLRLGAAYIGLSEDWPADMIRAVLGIAAPRVVLCDQQDDHRRLTVVSGPGWLRASDPWDAQMGTQAPPMPAPDPARLAYIAFTSGSTGSPKGVAVPLQGVVRLACDPGLLADGAARHFQRLAPLAFDASTLEMFVPLLAGGTVEIYGEAHFGTVELERFIRAREITGMWLTAGLFSVIAEQAPQCFRPLRQLLTGGDVVPSHRVRTVLEQCPGLRVTNGYGPTENTTFTTVHHADGPSDIDDPFPIGRPIAGTTVRILDETGQPLPPGAVGELCISGAGLATGYLADAAATEKAFPRDEFGRRYYRTGDLARWDRVGRLRYAGRTDRQVKIRGFRVELEAVTRVLRTHPQVSDAIVSAVPASAGSYLAAAVVGQDTPGLRAGLREHALRQLPAYSVPARWAIVPAFPITANGKVDVKELFGQEQWGDLPGGDMMTGPVAADDAANVEDGALAEVIEAAWRAVLRVATVDRAETFFDSGGDSLLLIKLHRFLLDALPGCEFTMAELMEYSTVNSFTSYIQRTSGLAALE